MPFMLKPEPAYSHGNALRTGVLLINLGTPDEPTAPALRRYLKQFLSDPRVVEIPSIVWWPILNGIILNVRPKKSAVKYASIWMDEGSPLRVYRATGIADSVDLEGPRSGRRCPVCDAIRQSQH